LAALRAIWCFQSLSITDIIFQHRIVRVITEFTCIGFVQNVELDSGMVSSALAFERVFQSLTILSEFQVGDVAGGGSRD
jgi:hypothetical protein